MNTALDTYNRAFEQLAPALDETRRAAQRRQLERFLALQFPTRKQETWRYTDLRKLEKSDFALPDAAHAAHAAPKLPQLADTTRMVFIDGRFDAQSSNASEDGDASISHGVTELTPDPADAIVALNGALSADGLDLHLQRGQRLPRVLHVLSYRQANAGAASMSHLRHRIQLDDNAAATVIFQQLGEGEYFGTEVLDITLGAGAKLKLLRLQEEAPQATQLARTDIRMARDASIETTGIDLGGGLTRLDFNVALEGEGGEVTLHALCAADGHSHVDNHTRIEHRAPRCRSREVFRGVVSGHAHAVFDGLIVVAPGAAKTDSDQQVGNLLLSPKAEINAKPELEIYNDDVKCNHGATTGQLDETALFYLRSRGLDALTAKSLLTRAFARSALDLIDFEPFRDYIEQQLDARLRNMFSEAAS